MSTGGAEGGAEGGKDPELDEQLDKDDDEQEVNRTQPFQPVSTSTPYHGGEQMEMRAMKTTQHEQSGLPDTSYQEETPLLGDFINSDDKQSMLERAKKEMKARFPKIDFRKLGPMGFSKKGDDTQIVSFGPKGGESKIFKSGTFDLLKSFTDKKSSALGPRAEEIISEDRDTIIEERQRLKETEMQLKNAEDLVTQKKQLIQEMQEISQKKDREQAKLDAIHDEHGSNLEIQVEVERLKRLIKNYEKDLKDKNKELASVLKKLKNKEELEAKAKRLREKLQKKAE